MPPSCLVDLRRRTAAPGAGRCTTSRRSSARAPPAPARAGSYSQRVQAAVCHALRRAARRRGARARPRRGPARCACGSPLARSATATSPTPRAPGAAACPRSTGTRRRASSRRSAARRASSPPGDHVVVTLVRSCGSCHVCRRGQPALCGDALRARRAEPAAHARDGAEIAQGLRTAAFAEQVARPPLPGRSRSRAQLPLDRACLLACGVVTGYGAVFNTAQRRPGRQRRRDRRGRRRPQLHPGRRPGRRRVRSSRSTSRPTRLAAATAFGATHVLDPAAEDAARGRARPHRRPRGRLRARRRGRDRSGRSRAAARTPRRHGRARRHARLGRHGRARARRRSRTTASASSAASSARPGPRSTSRALAAPLPRRPAAAGRAHLVALSAERDQRRARLGGARRGAARRDHVVSSRALALALLRHRARAALAAPAVADARGKPPPEWAANAGGWPAHNHDLANTRATTRTPITRADGRAAARAVALRHPRHELVRRVRLDADRARRHGLPAGPQLERLRARPRTGRLRWKHVFDEPNVGPNGVSFGWGRLYGATTTRAFALDPRSGAAAVVAAARRAARTRGSRSRRSCTTAPRSSARCRAT